MIFRELNKWREYMYLPTRTELYVFDAERVVMLWGVNHNGEPYYRGSVNAETVSAFEPVCQEWLNTRTGLNYPIVPKCKSGCCKPPPKSFKELLSYLKGKYSA